MRKSKENKDMNINSGLFKEVKKEFDNDLEIEIAKKTISIQNIKIKETTPEKLIEKIEKRIERIYKLGKGNYENNFTKYYNNIDKVEGKSISFKMESCNCNILQFLEESKPKDKGLDIGEIYDVFSQLNNAFRTMDYEEVKHGNIKLQNILVKPDKNEYLISGFEIIPELVKYEKEKNLGEVYHYLSPELLKEQSNFHIDESTDIWSIGVIMYYLYFREFPFPGESCKDVLKAIDDNKKNNKRKKTKFRDLNNLIDGLLEEDKKQRLTWKEYLKHPFFINNGFWKHYKEIEWIDNGAYSQVYKAKNKKSNEIHAIKIINLAKMQKLEESSIFMDSIKKELKQRINI